MNTSLDRRLVIIGGSGAALTACIKTREDTKMAFGLINQIKVTPGDRQKLMNIMGPATRDMPGCLSYILAEDISDGDIIWITELWESQADHTASLQLPAVQAAIQKGRIFIAGMTPIAKTYPTIGL